MVDESLYISTYEAALAVVATSMKKARLSVDMLILNSFMGGVLFSAGGLLHVVIQANCPELFQRNPGIIEFTQGLLYPIGLFYVVVLGADLFNSNVLYFGVGVFRGAVSILDLTISWVVSYAFNLVGNIFVCYLIVWFLHVGKEPNFKQTSIEMTMKKESFSFVETMIKGMAGNFFVCLSVYLQIMAKPLHVKLIMMVIPVFTFVSAGFSHAIADMFVLIMGLINSAPVSVGRIVWKVMIPEVIGNIIGGVFFAVTIPWYSHLVSVESDQKKLHLPRFVLRDEQPELNTDSRVVRQFDVDEEEEEASIHEKEHEKEHEEEHEKEESIDPLQKGEDSFKSSQESMERYTPAVMYGEELAHIRSGLSRTKTGSSTTSRYTQIRSPRNVFPVYGMGKPGERESSIASGGGGANETIKSEEIDLEPEFFDPEDNIASANYIGLQVRRFVSRRLSKVADIENGPSRKFSISLIPDHFRRRTSSTRRLTIDSRRLSKANLTPKSMEAADPIAGTSHAIVPLNELEANK